MGSNPTGPALLSSVDSRFSLFVTDEKGKTVSVNDLSKGKLVKIITKLSSIRKRKFSRHKETKYGNINKGFTEAELKHFFSVCKNEKAYLAFFLMASLGLRVGEVVEVKASDIDPVKHKLRVSTEKAHTGDFLFLHNRVRKILYLWVRKFQEKIVQNDGFILFSDNPNGKRKNLSADWLRNEFREVCYLADLNEFYAYGDDVNNPNCKKMVKGRKLHRLTTHSLRHYFITHVYKKSKDPVHTQKLARHREFKSTQVYINTSQEDIDKTMREVFEGEDVKVEDEVQDFLKLYETWKKIKK